MFKNKQCPPYYAVIFTSRLNLENSAGYTEMAQKMVDLAEKQSGFLGIESARDAEGMGITVSYWKSLEAIELWKSDLEHKEAQTLGKKKWYDAFSLRVCKVERDHFFTKERNTE
ncbi:MAG: antibiotic biosynthesis monooxygenase [Calditrichaeota bacterium]|nr:MAG: antibiotic biosynthesis monooxygenase [Calditrichota bacterium]